MNVKRNDDTGTRSKAGKYKMRTFARLTGFSPSLLRAWERRHGLLSPQRQQSRHRLYTDDDLRVMQRVKQLLESGSAIGEIAARGRDGLLAGLDSPRTNNDKQKRSLLSRIPRGGPLVELSGELVRAARDLDTSSLSRSLDRAFSLVSPRIAIEEVIRPAMTEIGARWAEGTLSVAGEHLVTNELQFRLHRLLEATRNGRADRRQVVCACLPDEQHELGLLTLALYLAQDGLEVTYLGARVPLADLERVCDSVGADAACVSGTSMAVVEESVEGLDHMAERWKANRDLHLGGQGVTPELVHRLSGSALHVWSSDTGLQKILSAVTGDRNAYDLSVV